MARDWKTLTDLTQGRPLIVERVRVADLGVSMEGEFELPPVAALSMADQVFVSAFIKSHGSIKEMERLFGVSYPSIKNRLSQISEKLGYDEPVEQASSASDVLERIEKGELSVEEALEVLRK